MTPTTPTTTGRSARTAAPRWFHRHRRIAAALIFAAAATGSAALLELAYRGQWVDFHRASLAEFNPRKSLLETDTETILALGDSFTAGRDNWPGLLQELLGGGTRVVNSGVSGSTVRQIRMIIDGRLERFRPRWVVYQIYTGNDLVDLRHPVGGTGIGLARGLYWRAIDRGLVGPWFVNTRLRLVLDRMHPAYDLDPAETERLIRAMEARPFAPETYSPRSRLLLQARPTLIHDQLALDGAMADTWKRYARQLELLIDRCREHGAELILVVVPHCAQVHPIYARRFAELGAVFPDPGLLGRHDPPLIAAIDRVGSEHDGVEIVNVLPTFAETEASGTRLYFNNDPHLNRAGRLELARAVSDAVGSR
jgi:hypothetical protein